jgi:hypothetical protein
MRCSDLSEATAAQFNFDMAYDLEQDWDFFYVQFSTDNDQNWKLLGNEKDANWCNSDQGSDGNNCFNCQGGQWTGTDTEMKTYAASLAELKGNCPGNIPFCIPFRSIHPSRRCDFRQCKHHWKIRQGGQKRKPFIHGLS